MFRLKQINLTDVFKDVFTKEVVITGLLSLIFIYCFGGLLMLAYFN